MLDTKSDLFGDSKSRVRRSAHAEEPYGWSTPKSAAFMFGLIALGLIIATLLRGIVM
jgi:hypothetical protein